MNHKRKRPKQMRAGCLMCKPNKLGKGMEKKLGHRGFGKLRKEAAAVQDMIDAMNTPPTPFALAGHQISAFRRALQHLLA